MADIRINDVPLMLQSVDGEMTTEPHVNYLIEQTGLQTLTVRIVPPIGALSFPAGAACEVEIWRCDGSGTKIQPLETVCTSVLKIGENDTAIPFKFDKKVFTAEVPFKILRWSACEKFGDDKALGGRIASFFRRFGDILAARQTDEYMKLVGEREHNLCAALYLGNEEIEMRNRMLFNCLSRGFELQPMAGKKKLQYYADRRLVTVLDADMKSSLRFINRETGEILAVHLFLGIKKGQKELSII